MDWIFQHPQTASDLLPCTLQQATSRHSVLAPGQITAIIPSSSHYSITPVIRSAFGSMRRLLETMHFLLPGGRHSFPLGIKQKNQSITASQNMLSWNFFEPFFNIISDNSSSCLFSLWTRDNAHKTHDRHRDCTSAPAGLLWGPVPVWLQYLLIVDRFWFHCSLWALTTQQCEPKYISWNNRKVYFKISLLIQP